MMKEKMGRPCEGATLKSCTLLIWLKRCMILSINVVIEAADLKRDYGIGKPFYPSQVYMAQEEARKNCGTDSCKIRKCN